MKVKVTEEIFLKCILFDLDVFCNSRQNEVGSKVKDQIKYGARGGCMFDGTQSNSI